MPPEISHSSIKGADENRRRFFYAVPESRFSALHF